MYGGNPGDGGAAATEKVREQNIREGISAVDQNFQQFNAPFYNQRSTDYLNYAAPQEASQLQEARSSLSNSLARRGLLNSGAAVQAAESLNKYAGQKTREMSDAATGAANDLQNQVENQRASLYSQVEASADPAEAANLATSSAAMLKRPTDFGPLGQMFSDWTSAYRANQVAQSVNPSLQSLLSQFSFGTPQGQSAAPASGYYIVN